VGGAIQDLLRLERYDVRRVTRLADAAALAGGAAPDVVLVDSAMLGQGRLAVSSPTIVLATGAGDGERAQQAVAAARGWIARDASAAELLAAVENVLTGRTTTAAGPVALAALGVLVLILVALLLYLLWIAIV
jgi:DNA-binding response OmpR family regulator